MLCMRLKAKGMSEQPIDSLGGLALQDGEEIWVPDVIGQRLKIQYGAGLQPMELAQREITAARGYDLIGENRGVPRSQSEEAVVSVEEDKPAPIEAPPEKKSIWPGKSRKNKSMQDKKNRREN